MPAYTQDELNALRAARARGVRVVERRFADRSEHTEYRSLAEMDQIIATMESALAISEGTTRTPRYSLAGFTKQS